MKSLKERMFYREVNMLNIIFWMSLICISTILFYNKWWREDSSRTLVQEAVGLSRYDINQEYFAIPVIAVKVEENTLFHTIPNTSRAVKTNRVSLELYPIHEDKSSEQFIPSAA